MNKYINLSIFALVILIITLNLSTCWLWAFQPECGLQPPFLTRGKNLPVSPFPLKEIDQKALTLDFAIPLNPIPDLRKHLTYQGFNRRPDAKRPTEFFFALGEKNSETSTKGGSKVYLKSLPNGSYAFSDLPTDLYFIPQSKGDQVQIEVFRIDESKEISQYPKERSQFLLTEKGVTLAQNSWSMGEIKVDSGLLSRLKASWKGKDLFLEKHGGEEFLFAMGKERVDFDEEGSETTLFLEAGSIFLFKDNHFVAPKEGEDTSPYPLLKVMKVDQRTMTFELYDTTGRKRTPLVLLKTQEAFPHAELLKGLEPVGSRTKLHHLFKYKQKRELLAPQDWFIFTEDGFKKIKSIKELDQIAQGKLKYPLLILDRVEGEKEAKHFVGTFYSSSHAEAIEVDIPITKVTQPLVKQALKINPEEEKLP